MRRLPLVLIALLAGALVLSSCGESQQDKAKNTVCDARSDIQKQVQTLQSMTASTASKDAITTSLTAIKDDLQKIAGAQDNLDPSRKQQVQSALQTFGTQLTSIAKGVVSSGSASGAQAAVTAAAQQLGAAFQQALKPISC